MYNFIFPLLAIIFSFGLALYVLIRSPKNIANIVFFFLFLSSNTWLFFSSLSDYVRSPEQALLFARMAMLGAPIFFAFVSIFSYIFPQGYEYSKKVVVALILPVIPVYFFVFSEYNIKSVKIESWGTDFEPGSLYYYVLLLVVVYLIISVWFLISKFKVSKGISKDQIKYIILSLCISSLVGFITNGILPTLFNYAKATVLGPSFTIIAINGIIAYAIIRYRLMSIRIVVQRIITNCLLFIIFFFLLYFIYKIEKNTYFLLVIPTLVKVAISSAAIIFLYHRIERMIISCTNQFFAKGNYDYSEILHKISDITASNHDLGQMLNKSLELISLAIGTDRVVFLLHDSNFKNLVSKKKYTVDNKRFRQLSLATTSSLAQYMIKEKNVVISEELQIKLKNNMVPEAEISMTEKAVKELNDFDIYLCQPLLKEDRLTAAICFGEKKSGESFSIEDIKLINTFADQLGMGIENRLAFEELKNKKEQLEKSMKLMVGRELDMINMKKELNTLKVNQ